MTKSNAGREITGPAGMVNMLKDRPVRKWAGLAVFTSFLTTALVAGFTLAGLDWGEFFSPPARCHVEGRVFVNGEPAANVNVAFHLLSGRKPAICAVGLTDTEGVFCLRTRSATDGAPAGDYSVTFFWPDDSVHFDECECTDPFEHDLLKGEYSSMASGAMVTVKPSGNSFAFELWPRRRDDPEHKADFYPNPSPIGSRPIQ